MTQIITNPTSYSEHRPEDGVKDNWAAEYAKREVDKHREAEVLDHPDGCVTSKKLSGEVQYAIATAAEQSADALASAVEANATADSAKASADIAVKESENAYEKSLAAHEKASTAENIANAAKAKSETAEQRAISAETKSDAAVASASGAVQKVENIQTDLEAKANVSDIYYRETIDAMVGAKADINNVYYRETIDAMVGAKADINNVYYKGTIDALLGDKADKDHVHSEYAKLTDVPSKVSELENDSGYLTEHQDISGKADKTNITNSTDTALSFEFSANHNRENRTGELTTISFTFGDGEYAQDYISGLSFDSGETPTAIDYTDSGILNWVGTDCVTSDGLSIFQPSQNTHYDIVFYFNGVQFIGLVNGFVPATGNEAV